MFRSLCFLFLSAFLGLHLSGQQVMKQVVIGSGGVYGDPSDHVTVTGFNPDNLEYVSIGEVLRESLQDMIIHNGLAYVAAEDSIVVFDLATNLRVASVYESNLSRLFLHAEALYVSRRTDINGPPADGVYLKAFHPTTLAPLGQVQGISTDAAGMAVVADTLFVAVPGDWTATEGKLAVVDMQMNLVREMNLGTDAVGIADLYADGMRLISVNRSPYLATTGSVTVYKALSGNITTFVLNHVVGKGVAIATGLLFLGIDYGIGSIDLNTGAIVNPEIVPDPGSASFKYIAAAAFDHTNKLIYLTVTDYFSMGEGLIYDYQGNPAGVFEAGIASEAIAIEYETGSFMQEIAEDQPLSVWPVPVEDILYFSASMPVKNVTIYDSRGTIAGKTGYPDAKSGIDLSGFGRGIYYVVFLTEKGVKSCKILKR